MTPPVKKCLKCGRKICFKDNRDYCVICSRLIQNEQASKAYTLQKEEELRKSETVKKAQEWLRLTELTDKTIPKVEVVKEKAKEPALIMPSSPTSEILFIVDSFGWAYENIARGIQKYSKYKIDITSWSDLKLGHGNGVDPSFLNNYDVVIDMVHACSIKAENWRQILNDPNKKFKFIVANWGHEFFPIEQLRVADAFIIGDKRIYKKFESLNLAKTYFIPEGIDTEYYKPIKRPKDRFIVGWAGNPRRINKRAYLLRRLKYPVKTMSNWGSQFFVKNRDQTEMVNFYDGLDVYVYVSNLEGGQSTTILEAMSSGLPVVSTDSGSEMKKLIGDKWLLPINPEEKVIQLMNEKLDELKNNVKLRLEVGKENRRTAEKYSWKNTVKKFDDALNKILGKPKVSILITNYNYGMYVGESVESALNQSYPNIEIIVVDDASTDRSVDILREYGDQIKLIVNEKNYGYQHAINVAIAASSGMFLTILDGNDVLHPNFLFVLMNELLKHEDYMAIYCGWENVSEDLKTTLSKNTTQFPIDDINKLLHGNYNCANSMIFQRECLKFMELSPNQWRDESLTCQGDVDWIIRFLQHAKLYFHDEILIKRRIHKKSWTANREDVLQKLVKKYRGMKRFKMGKYFECHPSVEIDCLSFEAGDCVTLMEGVKIKGRNIKIGNYVRFCPHSEIGGGGGVPTPWSNVTIGSNVLICTHVLINNAREVEIGDDVGLGQYVHIWTHGGWLNILDGYPCTFASVKIGSHVWIPERTSILAGVKIGDHVIIGNNSLVSSDIPAGSFAAGIPAKVIKSGVYPKPLTNAEIDVILEKLVNEYFPIYRFKRKSEPNLKYIGHGFIEFGKNIFDTNSMKISGELDEWGEDFRDYLRRNGIKFFTGKPFVSVNRSRPK